MPYNDLRGFLSELERKGLLKKVSVEVDPALEVSEVLDRLVKKGGPAVVFEKVRGYRWPIVGNLFGTRERDALGLGVEVHELREIGEFIAMLQRPQPPEGLWDAVKKIPFFGKVLTLGPKTVRSGACQEVVHTGSEADLSELP